MHYQFACLLSLVMDACYRDQDRAENMVDNEVHTQPCMDGNKATSAILQHAPSLAAFNRDLDSSESIPSDHSSLYDAARASFVFEEENRILYQGAIQDRGLRDENAGNVFSLDSPASSSLHPRRNEPPRGLETITEQQSSLTLQRSRSHSQLHGSSPDGDPPSKQPKRSSLAVAGRARRRKAVSFDDSASDFGASNWRQGVLSPVLPTQPAYPPPFRSPTPPGLPSFGSIEALTYSPGFAIGSDSTSQRQGAGSADGIFRRRSHEGPRSPFYSGALRRLFRAPPPSGPPLTLPMHAIARADDGTAVRGRFAYRQSGHGVDLTRTFDGHPFHRSHMPVAISMFTDGVSRSDEARRSKSGGSHEGSGPPLVADSSQRQAVGASPSDATLSLGVERLETAEPQTLTTILGISEPPLSPTQQAPEAPVPQAQDRVSLSTNNANHSFPAMPSVRADSILPTSNTVALPVVFPGVATTDGTSETTADGQQKTTSFWIGIWKNISDTFCCGLEHEEDTTVALYPPPESRRRNGNDGSFSSAAATLARSRTRGSEFSQAGHRYSGPWRPAYGFHPGEMSASSVV